MAQQYCRIPRKRRTAICICDDPLLPADTASPGQTDSASTFVVHERSQPVSDMDKFDVGLTNGAFRTNDPPDSDDSPLLCNPQSLPYVPNYLVNWLLHIQ